MPRETVSPYARIIVACVVIVLALAVGSVQAASEIKAQDWRRYPYHTVPRLAKAPVVDGTISAAEWQAAGGIGPLVSPGEGLADEYERSTYIGYDEQNLYIAWRIERPAAVRQPQVPEQTGHIDNWRVGDKIEIFLDIANAEKEVLNFVVYPNGAHAEGVGRPSIDKHWNCPWTCAASLTDDGWQGEATIPFKSLGLERAPSTGTIWGFDFVDAQNTPVQQIMLYGYRGPIWHRLQNMGHLRFGGDADAAPAVRFRRFADAGEGHVALELELVNDTLADDAAASLDVRLLRRKTVGDGAGPKSFFDHIESGSDAAYAEGASEFTKSSNLDDLIEEALNQYEPVADGALRQQVIVPANQSRKAGLLRKVGAGEYLALVDVRSASGDPLCSVARVMRVEPPLAMRIEPYWLRRQEMDVSIDLSKVSPPEGSAVKLALLPAAGETALRETIIRGAGTVRGTLTTAEISPGFYRIRAQLIDAQGAVLATNISPVEKPAAPPWVGNDLGKGLPRPWTPLKADPSGTVEVWGRVYDLSAALPKRVTANGHEILAEPVTLNGSSNQKPLQWRVERLTLRSADDQKATYDVTLAAAGARITGSFTIEFDGFIWYDLTLEPSGGELALDGLDLVIPISPSHGKLMSRHAAWWSDPHLKPATPRPAKFDPGLEGRLQQAMLPFTASLWIGDERAGFTWLAEAPVDWKTKEPDRVIQVTPPTSSGEPVRLVARFIDHPIMLAKPMRLQFALQATPIRPFPAEEISHLAQLGGPVLDEEIYAALGKAGATGVVFHSGWKGARDSDWSGWPGHPSDPEQRNALKQAIALTHKHGMKAVIYTGWGIATDSDEWKRFSHEMARKPLENSSFGTYRQSAGLLGVYTDYMAWTHAELMKEYDVDGVFWDSTANLPPSTEFGIGTGWIDDAGNVRPAYPIRGTRELFKRIYTLSHGEVKPDGLVVNFGGSIWAVNAFADIFHRGEGSPMHVSTLREAWQPLEEYRANYSGRPFGLLAVAMNKNFKRLPMTVNLHHAVTLLHGSHCKEFGTFIKYPERADGYDAEDQPMPQIWAARSWLPFDERTRWHPYYDAGGAQLVRVSPEHLLASAFVSGDGRRALVVVSNIEDAAVPEARVTLDRAGLGMSTAGQLKVEDAITSVSIGVADASGVLAVSIEPQRYRLLKVSVQP